MDKSKKKNIFVCLFNHLHNLKTAHFHGAVNHGTCQCLAVPISSNNLYIYIQIIVSRIVQCHDYYHHNCNFKQFTDRRGTVSCRIEQTKAMSKAYDTKCLYTANILVQKNIFKTEKYVPPSFKA